MAAEAITNLFNKPDLMSDPSFLLVAGAVSIGVLVTTYLCLPNKRPAKLKAAKAKKAKKGKTKADQQNKPEKVAKVEQKAIVVDHPLWISATSTASEIVGFAYDGRDLFAASSDERSIFFFDNGSKKRTITKLKDNATMLRMNDTHLAAFISYTDSFQFFKLTPIDENKTLKVDFVTDFPKDDAEKHKKDIISMSLAGNSKFVTSTTDDTVVKVWNTAGGSLLSQFNTNQMLNRMACISPDSRYISVAAFTSDVRVWEVCYNKAGAFETIAKVMDLRGHKTGVNCLCFSSDSTRLYTGAKDGALRVYRINVRYAMGEDPALEKTIETGSPILKMESSPDSKIMAIIDKKKVQFWDLTNGKRAEEIDFANIIEKCGDLQHFAWAKDSKSFVTAIGKNVHFWRSPV